MTAGSSGWPRDSTSRRTARSSTSAAVAGALPEKIELTLADSSPGMVKEATERCAALRSWQVTGIEADAAKLPFADASFDIVVAMHMLYHVPDPAVAIAEMHRVLKPGGRLVVSTNGTGNTRELYALTTALGSDGLEPVSKVFGYEQATWLLQTQFGNVEKHEHPASLRITAPEVVYLALTSYPPGDGASEAQLAAFRDAIDDAFAKGGGMLETKKEVAVFVGRKG